MTRLAGKTALITGAASGIGRATAELFLAEGANVVAGDILPETLPASDRLRPTRMDVTEDGDWVKAIALAEESFGRLDILVNNAGIALFKRFLDFDLEEWRRVHAVNLDGAFLGMKRAIPLMTKAGGGAIVNVASVFAMVAGPNNSAYCSSKAGLTLLTKAVALEMAAAGTGIRVNSVHPGFIDTAILEQGQDGDPERRKRILGSLSPANRLGTPQEVAAAILYLAGDEARFVNGSALVIDGGYTAR